MGKKAVRHCLAAFFKVPRKLGLCPFRRWDIMKPLQTKNQQLIGGYRWKKTPHYESYVEILREELIPAMGCTEPIAIALAAAKARQALGMLPETCRVEVSGNIIKNVKAVTVPNTGGLKGIEAATAAGVVAGRPELELEVLSQVTPEEIAAIGAFLKDHEIRVLPMQETGCSTSM